MASLSPDTHLCLVSDQPIPNLTPVLDPTTRPRRVILMVTPDKKEQADWLEKVLSSRIECVERWAIENPWDLEQIQIRTLELLEKESSLVETRAIALNATGGTKPMSIAAYEAFRVYELPIFYVHPERDQLIWLYPQDQPSHELADQLKLPDFLAAHGALIQGTPRTNLPDHHLLDLCAEMIRDLSRYEKALGTLNWLAGTAEKSLLSNSLEHPDPQMDRLIELFSRHGQLEQQGSRLRFPDQEARFFVNGGWLEEYVFNIVRRLRHSDSYIQDAAFAIEVERRQRGKTIPNELDVAFLRNNRLHLIECKTRCFQQSGEDSPGAETLYKLDSLRDLMGGLKARAMLVSYRKLPDYDRTRAADLGINVCAGRDLVRLQEHLKSFIR